jgi:hypothetical protein
MPGTQRAAVSGVVITAAGLGQAAGSQSHVGSRPVVQEEAGSSFPTSGWCPSSESLVLTQGQDYSGPGGLWPPPAS